MKTSHIIKRLKEDTEYQEFFKNAMKKFGISSPAELSGDKKKRFFNYVDKNYSAKTESFLNEAKEESGLMVFGRTTVDNNKIQQWLNSSDYTAEFNSRYGYWLFPEDEDSYDKLEMELDKAFTRAGINARFEGVF